MLMIMGLFINDVIIFLKMKTVLKICEATIKIKAIMKTITMRRLVSDHTGVCLFKNRWWTQLIFGFIHCLHQISENADFLKDCTKKYCKCRHDIFYLFEFFLNLIPVLDGSQGGGEEEQKEIITGLTMIVTTFSDNLSSSTL